MNCLMEPRLGITEHILYTSKIRNKEQIIIVIIIVVMF